MKRKGLVVVAATVLLLSLAAALGFAEYDKAAMQKVMQNNVANLPKLTAAANAGNFMEAAGYLISMSQGMYSIKDYEPVKGEDAHFKATVEDFLKSAFRGLAACADGNKEALQAAIAKMVADRNEGHAQHR